jgi:hypothetical protein
MQPHPGWGTRLKSFLPAAYWLASLRTAAASVMEEHPVSEGTEAAPAKVHNSGFTADFTGCESMDGAAGDVAVAVCCASNASDEGARASSLR